MLWCICLIDKPESKALREITQPAHTAYMATKDPQLFFSGPLQTDDGNNALGSLWILSADSRAEAQAFVDNEPYNNAGVFRSVNIYRMRGAHFHPELSGEVGVKPPPKRAL